jgi:MFS family permease
MTTFAVVLRDKDSVGPMGVAAILLAMMIPNIVFAPLGGLLADKFSTRTLQPPLLLVMGLSSASLALGWPHWWTYVALALTASCGVAVGASFNAALPTVAAQDDLPRASGLMQTYSSFGTLFAPALGGILVSTTGYVWPFIIDGVSFLVLGAALVALGINRPGVVHVEGEKLKAMDGMREVWRDQLIRSILILVTVLILTLGVINVGEVFLITDVLKANAFIYGLAGTAFAVGSILGGVGASSLKVDEAKHPAIVIIGVAVLVVAITGLALSWHWWVALAMSFVAGIGNSLLNAYGVGIIMRRSRDETRGRVMAAFGAVATSASVAASGVGGILIGAFGVRSVLVVGAALSAVVAVIFSPAVLRASKASTNENASTLDSTNRSDD